MNGTKVQNQNTITNQVHAIWKPKIEKLATSCLVLVFESEQALAVPIHKFPFRLLTLFFHHYLTKQKVSLVVLSSIQYVSGQPGSKLVIQPVCLPTHVLCVDT
eukprot:Trichotokara_eunicae@DN5598_c0_g1_i1.p2